MANAITLSTFEALDGALSSYGYASRRVAGGDLSVEAINGEISALNRLYDAVINDVGYDRAAAMNTHAELAEHAAKRVTQMLVSA